MVAYFCHHLSDNYVDLSDLYVVLSDLYVDLSDLSVELSLIYLLENNLKNVFLAQLMPYRKQQNYLTIRHNIWQVNIKIWQVEIIICKSTSLSEKTTF